MSRFVADHLPHPLVRQLSIDQAHAHAHHAILILTIDEHGWPHPAMLSSLELVARDARNIRLAPHNASRTARNLRSNGRLTIVLVDEQGVFYIKGDVLPLATFMNAAADLAMFNMRVDSVVQDVPEEYERARITSGIRVERDTMNRARSEAILSELMADG